MENEIESLIENTYLHIYAGIYVRANKSLRDTQCLLYLESLDVRRTLYLSFTFHDIVLIFTLPRYNIQFRTFCV